MDYKTKKIEYNTRKQIVETVVKEKYLFGEKARVALAIDMSGSMNALYADGTVQRVIERLLPVAVQFDDNAELDVWAFAINSAEMISVTEENYLDFVQKILFGNLNKIQSSGTNYAPVIQDIEKRYVINEPVNYASYVIFITDGENSDHNEATKAITEISKHNIFFQFVGIGNQEFTFLKKLDTMTGRFIDNANFFALNDLNQISDSDLYNRLLNEFPQWLEEAKSKNIINNHSQNPDPKKKTIWDMF